MARSFIICCGMHRSRTRTRRPCPRPRPPASSPSPGPIHVHADAYVSNLNSCSHLLACVLAAIQSGSLQQARVDARGDSSSSGAIMVVPYAVVARGPLSGPLSARHRGPHGGLNLVDDGSHGPPPYDHLPCLSQYCAVIWGSGPFRCFSDSIPSILGKYPESMPTAYLPWSICVSLLQALPHPHVVALYGNAGLS